jgi:hypothetical protein
MNKTKSAHKGFNVQGNLLEDVPFSEEHPHLVAPARNENSWYSENGKNKCLRFKNLGRNKLKLVIKCCFAYSITNRMLA